MQAELGCYLILRCQKIIILHFSYRWAVGWEEKKKKKEEKRKCLCIFFYYGFQIKDIFFILPFRIL